MNSLLHRSHVTTPLRLCSSMCAFRLSRRVNAESHCAHLKLFSLRWPAMWRFRSALFTNARSHSLHLCRLSPAGRMWNGVMPSLDERSLPRRRFWSLHSISLSEITTVWSDRKRLRGRLRWEIRNNVFPRKSAVVNYGRLSRHYHSLVELWMAVTPWSFLGPVSPSAAPWSFCIHPSSYPTPPPPTERTYVILDMGLDAAFGSELLAAVLAFVRCVLVVYWRVQL